MIATLNGRMNFTSMDFMLNIHAAGNVGVSAGELKVTCTELTVRIERGTGAQHNFKVEGDKGLAEAVAGGDGDGDGDGAAALVGSDEEVEREWSPDYDAGYGDDEFTVASNGLGTGTGSRDALRCARRRRPAPYGAGF